MPAATRSSASSQLAGRSWPPFAVPDQRRRQPVRRGRAVRPPSTPCGRARPCWSGSLGRRRCSRRLLDDGHAALQGAIGAVRRDSGAVARAGPSGGSDPRRAERGAPGRPPARLDAGQSDEREQGEDREHEQPGLVASGELLGVRRGWRRDRNRRRRRTCRQARSSRRSRGGTAAARAGTPSRCPCRAPACRHEQDERHP